MRSGWRGLPLIASAFLALCGIVLWWFGGGPILLIVGAIAIVAALAEPIYGRADGRPRGPGWRPTEEKFVDSETGELVTVWYDPATGERRYVQDRAGARAFKSL